MFFFLFFVQPIQDGDGVECLYDGSGNASGVMYGSVMFENNDLTVTREYSVDAWNSVQVICCTSKPWIFSENYG